MRECDSKQRFMAMLLVCAIAGCAEDEPVSPGTDGSGGPASAGAGGTVASNPCLEGGVPHDMLSGGAQRLAPGNVDWIARGGDDIYFARGGTSVFHLTETGEEMIVTDVSAGHFKVNAPSIVWVDADHATQQGLYKAARSPGSTAELVASRATSRSRSERARSSGRSVRRARSTARRSAARTR